MLNLSEHPLTFGTPVCTYIDVLNECNEELVQVLDVINDERFTESKIQLVFLAGVLQC
jgi:hypothetical protein